VLTNAKEYHAIPDYVFDFSLRKCPAGDFGKFSQCQGRRAQGLGKQFVFVFKQVTPAVVLQFYSPLPMKRTNEFRGFSGGPGHRDRQSVRRVHFHAAQVILPVSPGTETTHRF